MRKITPDEWRDLDRQPLLEQVGTFLGAFVLLGGIWFAAIALWAPATGLTAVPFLVVGGVFGGLVGLVSALAMAFQPSRTRTAQLRAGAYMMMFPITSLMAVVAAVVWVIRSVL